MTQETSNIQSVIAGQPADCAECGKPTSSSTGWTILFEAGLPIRFLCTDCSHLADAERQN